jgi:hypothetical protein
MSDQAHWRLRTPAAADYLGYSESTLEKKRLTATARLSSGLAG